MAAMNRTPISAANTDIVVKQVAGVLADEIDRIDALATELAGISPAELAVIDGVTPGTQAAGKAVVADANVNTGVSKVTQLHIGASGSETQVTATAAQLNYTAVTPGTQTASKAVVADANVNTGVSKVTQLHIGASGSETQVTATAAQLNYTAVTPGTQTASKAVVADANVNTGVSKVTQLHIGASGSETQVTATAAQINAAVAGTPLVYRTTVTAAQINAGTTAVVPAVAGKRFQVMHIAMAATLGGGNVVGPTTVEIVEETAGTVFLSHVTADLTDGTWHNLVTGTPVITGITAGGMTSADNKALLATCTGGTPYATSSGLDVIVVGYYTTT